MRLRTAVLLVALAMSAGACASSPSAQATLSSDVVHRPERITGVGAEGLAAPMEAHRPERIAAVAEAPVTPPVRVEEPAPEAPDLASIEVPPAPAPGTIVEPERVDIEDDFVTEAPRAPLPPSSRRHRAPPSSSMGGPIFSSPSVFEPGGPSSYVPSVPAPPLVH
jgi:hypothetical protein